MPQWIRPPRALHAARNSTLRLGFSPHLKTAGRVQVGEVRFPIRGETPIHDKPAMMIKLARMNTIRVAGLFVGLLLARPSLAEEPTKLEPTVEKAVVAEYRKLQSPDIEAKPAKAPPEGASARIDVSERMRSASFGHKTTLVVPLHGKVFYVEYGKSTNTTSRTFGPFAHGQKL